MEDELKLQQVIMSKVLSQLPGASYFKRPSADKRNIEEEEEFLDQLEKVVKEFETYRSKQSSKPEDYAKKKLEDYSLDDF